MNNKSIDLKTLDGARDQMLLAFGQLFNIFREEYGLSQLKRIYYDYIIDTSVKYALVMKYDKLSFSQCFVSKEINDQESFLIPETLRNNMKSEMDFLIERFIADNENIFLIDSIKELGRSRLLENSIKHQIKIEKKSFVNFMNKPFESLVKDSIDTYISNSIKVISGHESHDKDLEMNRELFSHSYLGKDNYEFKLETANQQAIEKYVNEFLDQYLNPRLDMGLNLEESSKKLLNTLKLAREEIENIFKHSEYVQNEKCIQVYKTQTRLFEESIERVTNLKKLPHFIKALIKANSNYLIKYKKEDIYPIIYDLVVVRFSLLMKVIVYDEELNSPQVKANHVNKSKYNFIDKSSDEYYLEQEFMELAEILPRKFKDMTKLLIKHYSNVFETDHDSFAKVLSQLHFNTGRDSRRREYELTSKLKGVEVDIDPDYFRILSLNVI